MNPSFDPAILVADEHGAALISGCCSSCDAQMFPRRPHCLRCGSSTEEQRLPAAGVVRSWCRLAIPLPGAEPPVTLVRVELGPQLTVQGVLIGDVEIGDTVELTARTITAGAQSYTGFGFIRTAS